MTTNTTTAPMMTEAEIAELEAKLEAVKAQAQVDAKKKIEGIEAEKAEDQQTSEFSIVNSIAQNVFSRGELSTKLSGLTGAARKHKRALLIAGNKANQIKAINAANLAVEAGIMQVFSKAATNKAGEVIGFNVQYRKSAGAGNIENIKVVIPSGMLSKFC